MSWGEGVINWWQWVIVEGIWRIEEAHGSGGNKGVQWGREERKRRDVVSQRGCEVMSEP